MKTWPVEIDKPLLRKLLERSEQRDFLEVAAECDIAFVPVAFPESQQLRDKTKSHKVRWSANPPADALGYAPKNPDDVILVVDFMGHCNCWCIKFGWHLGFSHAVTLFDAIDMERQLEKRKKELVEKK